MGYCMRLRSSDFRIKNENKPKALEAIKALAGQEQRGHGRVSRGGKTVSYHFSWVDTSRFAEAETFEEAMQAWRWGLEYLLDDVYGVEFLGEKLGDDSILFGVIAPFIEPGSYIEMNGEDGAIWRWYFDGQDCEEQAASTTYN